MSEEKEITVWDIGTFRSIEVEAAAFPIDVRTIAPGESARIEMRNRGKRPHVAIDRKGDHVSIAIDWDDDDSILGWFRWGRPARVTLHLPKGVRGRVATGAGAIRIDDLDCEELAFETGAGAIHAERISGRVALETGAGSIHVGELAGGIIARTNAGSIRLRVLALDPGTHTVHSEAGAVRVEVAEGLRVRVVPQVSFGVAKIDVPNAKDADVVLEVGSSAGAVSVRSWAGVSSPVMTGPYRTSAAIVSVAVPAKQPNELEHILEMVAEGTLTPDQAGELIAALDS